jgi:hypothetical protein
MSKLEIYWHQYFKEKKTTGEWFVLSKKDIKEFSMQKDEN